MECGQSFTLEPGEEKTVNLFGLFTSDLMGITEGTKASAKISLTYTMGGKEKTADYTPVLEVYNRNALTWDDDRKIASFITAKDPEILGFAKNVTNWMQEIKNPAVDENLQKGMVLFEAVKAYGIRYEVDPSTPFAELSGQKTAVDFLQFPRQTLHYSNGDCDDLTSLYTALLEAVGVETAVITIPGHIYGAFALKTSPDEARRTFSRPDELIITDNKVWVPVEITLFQETFEKAWQTGAKEYKLSLINLGNILFIKADFEGSAGYYQRVLNRDPSNKAALLGVSRCNHELENYGMAAKTYRKLKEIDPGLAMHFAYLDLRGEEATRAADAAGLRTMVLWEEE